MASVCAVTKAKARFSALVSEVEHRQQEVVLTRKGKQVAVIVPFAAYARSRRSGAKDLLAAAGCLARYDDVLGRMTEEIYAARRQANDRPVQL